MNGRDKRKQRARRASLPDAWVNMTRNAVFSTPDGRRWRAEELTMGIAQQPEVKLREETVEDFDLSRMREARARLPKLPLPMEHRMPRADLRDLLDPGVRGHRLD